MDSSTDEMECTGVQRGPFHVPRMLERWEKRIDNKSWCVSYVTRQQQAVAPAVPSTTCHSKK